ncbi:hypothetical protein H4R26_001342 [Coemansia thaxteri]|uniref:Very-long-chain 3-oxoacyl-CoA reductase n=1 Tax=Coemansia thaxteri TaxID=2663907 RepID=A0A9W8BMD8_9FUNG|nr:hypothetical protein H4R26_001342 [Coemansia thaxteri]
MSPHSTKVMFKLWQFGVTRDAAPLLGVTAVGCAYGLYVLASKFQEPGYLRRAPKYAYKNIAKWDGVLVDGNPGELEKDTALHWLNSLLNTLFTYVGIGVVAYYVSVIITVLYDLFVRAGIPLERFGAGQGAWAVVTGCTDGLGREAALELARKKFNIVLISRSLDKLEAMAEEVRAMGVETRVLAVDFAQTTGDTWAEIKQLLDSLRVGVLVNNVGVSYDYPMYTEEISESTVDALVELNMRAMVRMTRAVLPQMKERRSGLVLNSGSFAALLPSPFLAVYSGTKGFVKFFSQSLAAEVAGFGITVEHLQTYFVCSRMSKTKRPNFLIPLPRPYMRTVLAKIGVAGGSAEPYTSVPYASHALLAFVAERLAPRQSAIDYNYNLLQGLRKRAIKKKEREEGESAEGAKKTK